MRKAFFLSVAWCMLGWAFLAFASYAINVSQLDYRTGILPLAFVVVCSSVILLRTGGHDRRVGAYWLGGGAAVLVKMLIPTSGPRVKYAIMESGVPPSYYEALLSFIGTLPAVVAIVLFFTAISFASKA